MKDLTPAALSALVRGDFKNAEAAMTPGGIEAQEAAGQRHLVKGFQLPIRYPHDQPVGIGKAVLMEAGLVFGAPVDDLFQQVELPKGWSIKPTDHTLHSDLVDDQGRRRAKIFYKAAFYDRRASIDVLPRFSAYVRSPADFDVQGPFVAEVTDGGKPIWTSEPFFNSVRHMRTRSPKPEDIEWTKALSREDRDTIAVHESGYEQARKAGALYLSAHYPDHHQVQAYW